MATTRCGRCKARGLSSSPDACWYCLSDLCDRCWDEHGHCGHVAADIANERARAWKPGDPLLPTPWTHFDGYHHPIGVN